jgi:hypothetical protein
VRVAELRRPGGPPLPGVTIGLDEVQAELRELACGLHPPGLTDAGLRVA